MTLALRLGALARSSVPLRLAVVSWLASDEFRRLAC